MLQLLFFLCVVQLTLSFCRGLMLAVYGLATTYEQLFGSTENLCLVLLDNAADGLCGWSALARFLYESKFLPFPGSFDDLFVVAFVGP